MSIFDRLISTLTNSEEAPAPAPVKTPSHAAEGEPRRSRFMGRDGAESQAEPVVEKGFDGPSMIWLHVQPATQRLLLV